MQSDRLIDPTSLPQVVPETDISASDDILDAQSNSVAQHFDAMVKESTATQRQMAIDHMNSVMQANAGLTPNSPAYDSRHIPQGAQSQLPPDSVMFGARFVAPAKEDQAIKDSFIEAEAAKPRSAEDLAMLQTIQSKHQEADRVSHLITPHHKSVKTPEELAAEESARLLQQKTQQAQAVTPPKNPDIVNLCKTLILA